MKLYSDRPALHGRSRRYRSACRSRGRGETRARVGRGEDVELGVPVADRVGRGRRTGERTAQVPHLQHVRPGGFDAVEQHVERGVVPAGQDRAAAADRLGPGGVGVDRAEFGDRQRAHGVQHRRRDRPQRRDQPLRLLRCPEVGHPEVGDEPAAQRRREDVEVREGEEGDRQAELVGCLGRAAAVGGEQVGRGLTREVEAAAVEGVGGDEVDLQLGRDPEVAAAAAQGPEQLGIGVRGDLAQLAVRR